MADLKEYTTSNGKTVQIRRVSVFTLEAASRDLPKPKPPTQDIDGHEEPNYMHPDYLEGIQEWELQKRERTKDAILLCGIKVEIDPDELADTRAVAELAGIKLPTNDLLCYIKHCVVVSSDDYVNLQSLILDGSLPKEEGIAASAEDFKSGVQGQVGAQDSAQAVGIDSRES